MKILQINKYHYIKGGADSVFFNTMQLLSNHNHTVVPFCTIQEQNLSSEYEKYFVDAPEIRNMGSLVQKVKTVPRFISNKKAAKKLEELLQTESFDVAHIHNVFNGLSLSILPILRKHKIPVVITMHDTRFICPSSYFNLRGKWCENCSKSLYLNCALHKCYQDNLPNSIMCAIEMFHKEHLFSYDKYISRYIFASNRFKTYHANRHPYFDKKGIVLHNFLPDMERFTTNSDKGNYLLYYGRITVEKGILTLVEVMKNLPDVMLKVAGTGPLLETIRGMKLPNIDLLGFVSGDELFQLVRNSSFVVVPSECEENNPLTVIEAYSCGKPVIGSRIGGIPEIVEEGTTGYIFEPFDKNSLEEAINKAIHLTANEYRTFSLNARSFAERNFHPERHYETLLSIYNQAISNNENI